MIEAKPQTSLWLRTVPDVVVQKTLVYLEWYEWLVSARVCRTLYAAGNAEAVTKAMLGRMVWNGPPRCPFVIDLNLVADAMPPAFNDRKTQTAITDAVCSDSPDNDTRVETMVYDNGH